MRRGAPGDPALCAALILLLSGAAAAQTSGDGKGSGGRGRSFDLFYTLGYRWVDVDGSRDRYDSDFDLDEGFRATHVRLDARFEDTTRFPETITIESSDIGDPFERHRLTLDKPGLYSGSASFERSQFKYRASGDFARVDRKEQVARYGVTVPTGNAKVFASFSRSDLDGFWLTNRLGNRNLSPVESISGVRSPRRVSEDEAELGFTWHKLDTTLTVVGEYLDQNEVNEWSFSRPAQANPAFDESEDSDFGSSLEGPGVRLEITQGIGPLDLALNTRFLERRRRVVGTSTGTGYDTAQFDSALSSAAEGASRTLLAGGTISWEIRDDLVFHSELHYHDHREHLFIRQTETTDYPTIPTTVVVQTNLDQRTESTLYEATAELDWQPHKALTLTGGWGWSQEELLLPDLDPADADYLRGTTVEDGYIAGLHWRPDAHWSLRTRYRDFGQGGLQLHQITDHRSRGVVANLGYRKESLWYDLGFRHDNSRNPVADTRSDSTAYTLGTGYAPSERLSWHGSYTYSEVDSRTRSNFYFDPSPTPVSTLVGFRGDTHSLAVGLEWRVTEWFHTSLQGAYTTVHGDFDVDMLHLRVDLARLLAQGRIGVRVEQMQYDEEGGLDDYDAMLVYLYFAAEIRGHRPDGTGR